MLLNTCYTNLRVVSSEKKQYVYRVSTCHISLPFKKAFSVLAPKLNTVVILKKHALYENFKTKVKKYQRKNNSPLCRVWFCIPSPYLLKQLETICVVIICKVNNTSLAAVYAEGLPEPPQGQVPLYGTPRYSGIPSVPAYLVVSRCLDMEVGVVKSCLMEETAYKNGPPLGVLHKDPVQVGHVQKGIGQTCQLCFLHWPAVGGSDNVDGGKDVRPRWRPAVHILGAHHLHNVSVLERAGLFESKSIPRTGAPITSVI